MNYQQAKQLLADVLAASNIALDTKGVDSQGKVHSATSVSCSYQMHAQVEEALRVVEEYEVNQMHDHQSEDNK